MQGARVRIFTTLIAVFALLLLGASVAGATQQTSGQKNTNEVEPNDTIATANPIGVGVHAGVNAQISPAGDVDFFQFSGIAGHTYVAEMYDVASVMDNADLYGYDSNGQILDYTNGCNGNGNVCARIQFTVPSSGNYFVRASAYSSGSSGTYQLRVLPRYDQGLTHGPDGEPNDALALAEPINVGTAGALSRDIYPRSGQYVTVHADVDWYRFHGVAGNTYVAEMFDVAAGMSNADLYGYDSNGQNLDYTNGCNGSGNVCARIQFTVPVSGDYFLRASPYSDNNSGSYQIRVLPRYDQGLTHGPDGEPNDALALAEPINVGKSQALARKIYPRSGQYATVHADADWYHFHGARNRTYSAELYNVAPAMGDMDLYAYDSTGQLLAYTNGCNESGKVCAKVVFTVPASGEYFLRATPYSDGSSGVYKARVFTGK